MDRMVNGAWLDEQVFPPLEWTVEGVLPEGFGLLVAPPKAGKSWMAAGIGLACASGGYALGKIPVKRRPVLYLALEDGHRRLQDRFRRLMDNEPIPAGINIITRAKPLEITGIISEFLELHRGEKPLIILDTLGKVKPPRPPGADPYQHDYGVGSGLKDLIDTEPGGSLLVVHHARKAESADFIDAVSGTHGIAGAADFIIVINRRRHEDTALLAVTGRDVTEGEYALTSTAGSWVLDGSGLGDASAAARKRREEGRLGDRSGEALEFVNSRPLGTRAKDLAGHLGIDDNMAGNYLRRLHESERIAKRTRGVYTPLLVEVVEVVETDETTGQGVEQQDLLSTTSTTVVETGEQPPTSENTTSTTSTTNSEQEGQE